MGWKEYLAQRRKRYTFEELECPDFWIEMRGLESFSHGESIEIAARMQDLSDDDETLKASHELLAKVITGWNLTDPETDEVLPLPREDISSLLKLPNEFIIKMNEWVAERMNPEEAVPPKSES